MPNVVKIWESKPPGILWATPGLLRDDFNFLPFFSSSSCGSSGGSSSNNTGGGGCGGGNIVFEQM